MVSRVVLDFVHHSIYVPPVWGGVSFSASLLAWFRSWGFPFTPETKKSHKIQTQGVQRPELRRPFKHGGFSRPFYRVFMAVDKRPKFRRPRKLWETTNWSGCSGVEPWGLNKW